MSYISGFVLAVPTENKEKYRQHAESAVPIFKELGAGRMVETWGDDVPKGKVTDFQGAVDAKPDETVLFSWIEFADKATADSFGEKMMSDPRMEQFAEMPFDGQRMIFGGFEPLIDEGPGGTPGYVDGFLVPVPEGNAEAYRKAAAEMLPFYMEFGATRLVEAIGRDLSQGKVTDFFRAVKAEPGETVVFSWVEWPDKATRQAGWEKMSSDERIKKNDGQTPPFDGTRMIYGGFEPILDL